MDNIIQSMKKRVHKMAPSNLEVIDLTKYRTFKKQINVLKKLDKIDTPYVD